MKTSSRQWPLSWFSYYLVSHKLFVLITFPLLCLYLPYHTLPGEAFCVCVFMWCVLLCISKSQSSPCLRQGPVSSYARRTGPQACGGCSCLCFPSCSGNTGLRDVRYWTWLYMDSVDLNSDPYACAARALPTDPSPQLSLALCEFCGSELRALACVAWRFSSQSHFPSHQTLYLRKVFFFFFYFFSPNMAEWWFSVLCYCFSARVLGCLKVTL